MTMYIERIFRRVVCGVFSNVCATLVRMLLDNDTFLTSLHKLFNQSKSSGSLYITMKRYDGRVKPIPKRVQKVKDVHVTNENSCLLRATLGNQKISTVVHQKDMNRFNQAYSNLLKANIDGLKKRDKRVKSTNISSKLNRPKTEKG